jgi:hypothetical protein
MRRAVLVAGLSLLVAALAPGAARADSHGWWGRLGPVGVHVWRIGFAEGAGEGGWSETEAREFAAWAAQLRASLPAGVGVEIAESPELDDAVRLTLLRCRAGDGRCERPLARQVLRAARLGGAVELDARFATRVLGAVGSALGRKLTLRPASPPRLYTIQLLAARSEARARDAASRIDRAYVHGADYVFDANCGPCSAPPESRSEDGEAAGAAIHRVFVGNYESPRLARADLAALARLGFDDAFVRPLAPPSVR